LIWAAVADADLDERSDELRRQGWGDNACKQQPAPTECSELREDQETQDLLSTVGVASLVASGVFGAATLASFLLVQPGRAREGVRVAPLVGDRAGLVVRGVW
jgi:hypothetical protein